MAVTQVDGWTVVADYLNSQSSKIIYISSSGNDQNAALAKEGRGYYLIGDTEVGSDPTQPIEPQNIVAYKTYSAARSIMQSGDCLLFKRGDTFNIENSLWINEAIQIPDGPSSTKRSVVSSYGDLSLERPIILSNSTIQSGPNLGSDKRAFLYARAKNLFFSSIEPRWANSSEDYSGPALMDIREIDTTAMDIHLEDIYFKGSCGTNYGKNIILRRCVIVDTFNKNNHTQGYFGGTSNLLIEECVFDRNGYKEDPNNPSTWTRSVSENNMAVGTGVQPRRDFYSRNIYFSGDPEIPPTLQGNIFSRGAGGGSVQMRSGGIAERNLFIWNEQALLTGHGQQAFYSPQPSRPNWIGFNSTEKKYRFNSQTQQFDPNGDLLRVPTPGVDFPLPAGTVRAHVDAVISDNLLLHDDHMLPPGGWGIGFETRGTRYLSVTRNILAHFHRGVNSHWPGTGLGGIPENNSDYYPYPTTLLETGIFTDNAVLRQQGGNSSLGGLMNIGGGAPRALSALVGGNAIAGTQNAPKVVQNRLLVSGNHQIDNNLYLGTTNTPIEYRKPDGTIVQGSFAQYQQDTQRETNSQYFLSTQFEQFKTVAGWIAPERDIVSYMQSIDPTYVVDEDVTVDDGVFPPENRRPNAQKVWEVLINPAFGGQDSSWWGDTLGGNVNNAKLIARRYHAFLTFIDGARANRRGAWNVNYTAEALNNYIRYGFGKSAITGDYNNTSLNERITNETNSCSITELFPSSQNFLGGGGNGDFSFLATATTGNNCIWAATSNENWISLTTITGNSSETGTAFTVLYTVSENYSVPRSGTISVGGQIHFINQEQINCDISLITPNSITANANGETGSIEFSTPSNLCSWEVNSDSPWINIVAGSTGNGQNGSVSYNIQQNSLTSQRSGSITIGNSIVTITQQPSFGGSVQLVDGWTVVTPSADSRLIYVSNGGNDQQAKAVKGRGYYLPSDPEIGPDPYNPIGPIISYATPREAIKKMRPLGWVQTNAQGQDIVSITVRDQKSNLESPGDKGWPDWFLLKRGDTFEADSGYQSPGWGFLGGDIGSMFAIGWGDNIAGGAFRYEAGPIVGRSEQEPFVISAWGDPSQPRPVIHGGFTLYGSFALVSSLDVQVKPNGGSRQGLNFRNSNPLGYDWWKCTLEDCRSEGHSMIFISGGGPKVDLTVRRCVWADGWNPSGHNSSPFNGLNSGAKLTFEECVFDRNGYKENPADATRWTGKFTSSLSTGESGESGTGVQPTRTWFDRNWYMSGNAGNTLILRGNIAARTGGGAEQLRSGGLAYRNVFLFNHDGLLMGSDGSEYGFNDSFVVQNLFLHDDLFLPPGGWGMNNYLQGANAVVAENVYAHPHSRLVGANGPATFFLWNTRNYFVYPKVLIGNVVRAATQFRGYATQRSSESLDHPTVTIKNNEFAFNSLGGYGYGAISRTTKSDLDVVDENLYFGNTTSASFSIGYASGPPGSRNRSFETWQSAGYDTNGQMIGDWNNFKTIAGWIDPDRDIVSYMQTIDPNYVPDENVRVDYGTKIQQSSPQLVKDVIPSSHMNEQQKVIAAKRFHAAITFLNRARENRKGSWDSNYTAEALNDYIRAGFGKSSLAGTPYLLKLEDIFSYVSLEDPCLITEVNPTLNQFSESGGTGSVSLSATDEACPWSAVSNVDWITITENSSGTGSLSSILYSVSPNYSSSSRSGTISVGGQIHTVSQQALDCQISAITPTSESFPSTGGTGSVSFSTSSNICSWQATSSASWVSITQGSSGSGETGIVNYSVEQNPLTFSRSGIITIDNDGQIVITQEASLNAEVGVHLHKVKGSYSGQIERVFNKEYFLDLSCPVDRQIIKVVVETLSGECFASVYNNNKQIVRIEASTNRNSVDVTSENYVLTGETIKIRIDSNNKARGLKFSVHYEQESGTNI